MDLENIKKTFFKSKRFNSGLNCLFSIIRFYGGKVYSTQIRNLFLSGLGDCSSLLKLHEASKQLGFDSNGYQAELNDLKNLSYPVILMISAEKQLTYYAVCYGYDGRFLIGDPLWGVVQYTDEELDAVWSSKMMLQLTPNESFKEFEGIMDQKRKLFWIKIKERKKSLLSLITTGVIAAILVIVNIYILKRILNLVAGAKEYPLSLISIFLFTMFAWIILRYITEQYMNRYITTLTKSILYDTLQRIFTLTKTHFNSQEIFNNSWQINQIHSISDDIRNIATVIIYFLPLLTAILIISAFLNIYVFFIMFFGLFLYILLCRQFNKAIFFNQINFYDGQMNNYKILFDVFSKMMTIRVYNKENLFKQIIKHNLKNYQTQIFKLKNLKNNISLWQLMINICVFTAILIICNIKPLSQKVGIAEILSLLAFAFLYLICVNNIIVSLSSYYKVRIIYDYFFELNAKYDKSETFLGKKMEIMDMSVENVDFRYTGSSRILKNITFKLHRGEKNVIFGANGSGKSTLIEILQGYLKPESGSIFVNGKSLEEIDIKNLRYNISVVNSHPQLIHGTIIDNICVGIASPHDKKQVMKFCDETGMNEFFQRFPQKYLTIIDESATGFSGGQLQLISLIRALYKKPAILLLDESFTGLDSKVLESFENLLERSKSEMTILITTTDVRIAQKADYVYILDKETITIHGKPDEVLQPYYC